MTLNEEDNSNQPRTDRHIRISSKNSHKYYDCSYIRKISRDMELLKKIAILNCRNGKYMKNILNEKKTLDILKINENTLHLEVCKMRHKEKKEELKKE